MGFKNTSLHISSPLDMRPFLKLLLDSESQRYRIFSISCFLHLLFLKQLDAFLSLPAVELYLLNRMASIQTEAQL